MYMDFDTWILDFDTWILDFDILPFITLFILSYMEHFENLLMQLTEFLALKNENFQLKFFIFFFYFLLKT